MKELTIEQKAKAYDKVREKIALKFGSNVAEEIFSDVEMSEDEKIRKTLIEYFNAYPKDYYGELKKSHILAWLEKQDEQKPFDYENANIQQKDFAPNEDKPRYSIGDVLCDKSYTTLNKDVQPNFEIIGIRNGMYICDKCSFPISQQDEYELVAKKIEQKPADKAEPKFHKGDWLCENEPNNYARFIQILETVNVQGKERYRISRDIHNDEDIVEFDFVEKYYHKFNIKDAKDGDVLHASSFSSDCIFIFDRLDKWKFDEPNGERAVATGHCCLTLSADNMEFGIQGPDCIEVDTVKPATKIQRDLLFQKMKEAGYEWDAEKKELKKIEDEEYNGEDYGIDSLYHAQRILEKTLGSVDGYQSDDGILEHKCAISAVKKLYEQKPAEWSKEEEKMFRSLHNLIYVVRDCDCNSMKKRELSDWLKFLKDRVQHQNTCYNDDRRDVKVNK